MAAVDKALTTDCPRVFAQLEKAISGPFIVGDQLTLADVALHCIFVNLKLAGHPLDAERWPKLGGYIAGLMARPTLGAIRDPKAA
jgi:glutathione S-transferase